MPAQLSHASLAGVILALGLSLPSTAAAQGTNGGRVLGIHLLTIKSGADAKALEACMAKQTAAWKGAVPGLKVYLMKGDQGDQNGQYALVYELDSVARRNEYWPTAGAAASPKFQEYAQKVQDLKCEAYLETGAPDHYTDFVVLQ